MPFDVYALDNHDWASGAEEELSDYQDALLEALSSSPEGQAHGDVGFWTSDFVRLGFIYIGVSLPQMTEVEAAAVVEGVFPEKISIFQAEDAEGAIPELIALWTYLKRVHGLPHADAILAYLHDIEPDFPSLMMDSSRFGMARSFVMMGQEAGFDMSDEKETGAFIEAYNAALLLAEEQRRRDAPESAPEPAPELGARSKRRQKRKAEKAARRKQRGKR